MWKKLWGKLQEQKRKRQRANCSTAAADIKTTGARIEEGQALNSRLTEASTIGNKKRRAGEWEWEGRGWVEQLK
ncbi:hypothetical protein WR25_18857 [Diploscapter pachys]|uniref:Uncharacterized protein n=1 Tax=Diploscapter pachys TaxID=2018661 RepID=A0A2A2KAG4_9BILA|nr:hypothetical protein WR25_18857 [Diploscapter pachys]